MDRKRETGDRTLSQSVPRAAKKGRPAVPTRVLVLCEELFGGFFYKNKQKQVSSKYHTVKSHFKALGLYNFIRGFGSA